MLRILAFIVITPLVVFACDGFLEGLEDQPADRDPTTVTIDVPQAGEGQVARTGRYYSGTVIASDPSIVQTGGSKRMYYTDLDTSTNRTVIAAASSQDGDSWSPVGRSGAVRGEVLAGQSGSWAENVESASVVQAGGQYRLYFSGYRDRGNPFKGFPAALGVVTSSDGVNFGPLPEAPVLSPTRGWYDNDAIYSPTILYENGTYYMIYVGHAYTDTSQIGGGGVFLLAATSTDGVNWTKRPEPVARPGQFGGWRSEGLAEPYLVKQPNGRYALFYTGLQGENRAIGVALGPSPLGPFDFSDRPILEAGARGTPDEHQVLAPAAVVEDGRVRMWYLAADDRERLSVGQAETSVGSLEAFVGR